MKRALVLILALAVGCSSNYIPQARGRVAIILRNGAPAYVRDGQTYPHGFLGSGLEAAVAGSPSAMAAAHEYRSRQKTGFVAMMLGLAAEIGGFAWAGAELANNRNPTGSQVGLPLGVAVAGLVVMFVGAGYVASAEPYRWDAINLFNDTSPALPPGMQVQAGLHKTDAMLSFPP